MRRRLKGSLDGGNEFEENQAANHANLRFADQFRSGRQTRVETAGADQETIREKRESSRIKRLVEIRADSRINKCLSGLTWSSLVWARWAARRPFTWLDAANAFSAWIAS